MELLNCPRLFQLCPLLYFCIRSKQVFINSDNLSVCGFNFYSSITVTPFLKAIISTFYHVENVHIRKAASANNNIKLPIHVTGFLRDFRVVSGFLRIYLIADTTIPMQISVPTRRITIIRGSKNKRISSQNDPGGILPHHHHHHPPSSIAITLSFKDSLSLPA